MKTECSHSRRALLVSTGFLLALLVSSSPPLYAQDRRADKSIVESKIIKGNEYLLEPANNRDVTRLVGPSSEEIHDFLYPAVKDRKRPHQQTTLVIEKFEN